MSFLRRAPVIAALLIAYGLSLAKPVNSVQTIRGPIDKAFIGNQARFRVSSDISGNLGFSAKAGVTIPVGGYDLNTLGAYNGVEPSLSAGFLGNRLGVEGTLAPGKKQATLEGTLAGLMGQGTWTSTDDGASQTVRVSRAEEFGPWTLQAGGAVNRSVEGEYRIGGDLFCLLVTKVGKTILVPLGGASLNQDLSGLKYVNVTLQPEGSKAALGLGLVNGGNLAHPKEYVASAEVKYNF